MKTFIVFAVLVCGGRLVQHVQLVVHVQSMPSK